ncbi:methylated-DNA--[protein]-cysteine S-methyltransferase [Streptomyces sp. NBC_00724]|uniref:methylated-DNA--[protein]-cysteine S-methyltransferase n=1 Tax=Streptomyces sp. NBC_00724 TaxID=2975812 RepID=UPI002ED4899F|nr:methylated-DNA--[protein]-cysteine S-methyltransferase [Streptomyces sp. NBC_00724]
MRVHTVIDSPLGQLLLVGEESGTAPGGTAITSLSVQGMRKAPVVRTGRRHDQAALAEAVRQIRAYLSGELTMFQLEFMPTGTEFQQQVWGALDAVPYGTTTYGKLTERLGLPRERVQAVGGAVGANPLLLVRPCHRVIGADGSMRGHAGGVKRKMQLLTHEGALQPTLI